VLFGLMATRLNKHYYYYYSGVVVTIRSICCHCHWLLWRILSQRTFDTPYFIICGGIIL